MVELYIMNKGFKGQSPLLNKAVDCHMIVPLVSQEGLMVRYCLREMVGVLAIIQGQTGILSHKIFTISNKCMTRTLSWFVI